MQAGDDDLVDRRRPRARPSSAPRARPARRAARRPSRRSAPPTASIAASPGLRQRSVNSSRDRTPTRGTRPAAGHSCRHRRAAPHPRRRPAASSPLPASPLRASAATVSTVDELPSAASSAPTAERCAPPKSAASTSLSSRSAAATPVAFVLSTYAGLTVEKYSADGRRVGPGPAHQPRRLDPEGRGVLVVPGHRAGALAAAGADECGDFRPVQSAVRHVAGSRENAASHVWQPNLRDNTFQPTVLRPYIPVSYQEAP